MIANLCQTEIMKVKVFMSGGPKAAPEADFTDPSGVEVVWGRGFGGLVGGLVVRVGMAKT